MNQIEKNFSGKGGIFVSPFSKIVEKLNKIKVIIFDWDGVFNDGMKVADQSSTFSEIDSMGTNMLRFSFWLKYGSIPVTAIITGANNRLAEFLVKRECFNYLFLKNKNKSISVNQICNDHNLNYENAAFVFDDILDLDVAQQSGLRFLVNRNSSPLFEKYVFDHKLADYISGNNGNNGAVREISELMIGMNRNYNQCVEERIKFSETYKSYLDKRNSVRPEIIVDNSRDI